jgi:hypothetical protein
LIFSTWSVFTKLLAIFHIANGSRHERNHDVLFLLLAVEPPFIVNLNDKSSQTHPSFFFVPWSTCRSLPPQTAAVDVGCEHQKLRLHHQLLRVQRNLFRNPSNQSRTGFYKVIQARKSSGIGIWAQCYKTICRVKLLCKVCYFLLSGTKFSKCHCQTKPYAENESK